MEQQPRIVLPNMCLRHRQLLVAQTGFGPNDSWQVLEAVTNITLFQGASCDQKVYEEVGGKIENFVKLGCLACRKPDLFGEIVQAVQQAGKVNAFSTLKALGERWVNEAKKEAGQ